MAETKEEKAKRMAEALRANLKRRKVQKKDIAQGEATSTDNKAPEARQFRTKPLTKTPLTDTEE